MISALFVSGWYERAKGMSRTPNRPVLSRKALSRGSGRRSSNLNRLELVCGEHLAPVRKLTELFKMKAQEDI